MQSELNPATLPSELFAQAPARHGDTTILVAAPHHDDDVLGCGGTLALAAAAGHAVRVVYVTDGSASHPASREFPPARIRTVREAEAVAALAALGIGTDAAVFLGWPDGSVPAPHDARALPLLDAFARIVRDEGPAAVFLPWRRDPHPDHRAVSALVRAVLDARSPVSTFEYAVWLDERGDADDAPRPDEGRTIEVDVTRVLEQKRKAIEAHRSQRGLVVGDAPGGFTLPDSLVARALCGIERFVHSPR